MCSQLTAILSGNNGDICSRIFDKTVNLALLYNYFQETSVILCHILAFVIDDIRWILIPHIHPNCYLMQNMELHGTCEFESKVLGLFQN